MYPKESLEIISRMMNDTRRNVMLDSRMPLLVWGWLSFAVSVMVYAGLRLTGDFRWNFAWFLILLIGIPLVKILKPAVRPVTTAISKSLVVIWKMLAVLIAVFSTVSFFADFKILSVVLMILAIGSFITGEAHTLSIPEIQFRSGFRGVGAAMVDHRSEPDSYIRRYDADNDGSPRVQNET